MKRQIALVLWALAATPTWAQWDRAVLIDLAASVLKIEVSRVQGGFSLGSGVVVAQDRVVTNCHVTRDALKINVLRGGMRWPADAQLSDVGHDLCLLRVRGLAARAAALGRADELRPGQPVAALGYTGGLALQSSQGEVLALHRFDGGRVIQSSNGFSSGASGGGLFDEESRLVGILSFRLRGGAAHYFSAPVEWLRAMLDAPQEAYLGVAPDLSRQVAYWQRPVLDQPRFLKAASLQRDGQWTQLEALACEWARTDADDPEPWHLLALSQTRRSDEQPAASTAHDASLETVNPGTPCVMGIRSP